MENYIVILILLLIVALITFYFVKQKKKGNKCIGCPYCDKCSKKYSENYR